MSANVLSIEKLANATIKNRAEYSQLSVELNRIEKEKRNELRMLTNEKQRFMAKYSKANFGVDSTEASDVKMYKTHNPGFCYRRNGEHRVPQSPTTTPPVDFKHLQFLLFTNGEVDIEKVLCLHLLSSHETEHLTPPRRPRTSSKYWKKDSPIEQLIERSKGCEIEAASSTGLPTYVLDVNKENIQPNQKEDERLSSRLIVNEKILELITTVITALEHTNPEKVQHLMGLADDPSSLKRIFRKPHIQEFVTTLKEHCLVQSCSSFVLTQPTKARPNHIEIRTASGALEDLVRFIRSNVLQFPNRDTWKIAEEDSRELITFQNSPPPVKKNIDVRRIRSPKVKAEIRREPKEIAEEEMENETNRFRRVTKDFIAKNIAAIANYKKIEEDEELPKLKRAKRSSTDTRSVRADIRKTAEEESVIRELKQITNRKTSDVSNAVRFHIKQTTCRACMEKWKVPLPSPKVSKVAKPSLEPSSSASGSLNNAPNVVLRTNSIQRISTMIEREKYKLSSYDRKYSNSSNISNLNQNKRSRSSQSGSMEAMDLSVLDLEKVRQAVREKETKKKLEKFLGE
ncbi:uncharacterized protein BDFB_005667 [Asbolus verrucosus]|uniref:Uncharacterized protein n=1 Tax=Asbolus verrucosus TaxID=1661398 RepID=A0A482VB44_ASBVE|nr:uncharacterized protein BDFB_005667 [Asbolus verrucosus]